MGETQLRRVCKISRVSIIVNTRACDSRRQVAASEASDSRFQRGGAGKLVVNNTSKTVQLAMDMITFLMSETGIIELEHIYEMIKICMLSACLHRQLDELVLECTGSISLTQRGGISVIEKVFMIGQADPPQSILEAVKKATTTASSLDAEQDSGNIKRTQSMATLNESNPYGTNSDHNLWDVIINGDLEEELAPTGETFAPPTPKTAKQLAAKRN
ncbi:hypothetical protein Tco_0051371 [Tanacetum coccineum]